MNNEGLRLAAFCAHPGTIVSSENSKTIIDHKRVIYDIRYANYPYQTIIVLEHERGIPTNVYIHGDTHWYPAFRNTEKFLYLFGMSEAEIHEEDPTLIRVKSFYERIFGNSFTEWTGEQLTTAIIALAWAKIIEDNFSLKKNTLPPLPKGQKEKELDGILIRGDDNFISKVGLALGVIEKYYPEFYNSQLKNTPDKFNVVRGIIIGNYNFNTVGDGWVINLYRDHALELNRRNAVKDIVYLAMVIVHETVHLHQYARYFSLYNCNFSGYLFGNEYDPVTFADNEIEAYDYSNAFLMKLNKKNEVVDSLKKANDEHKQGYNSIIRAGSFMFQSRFENSDCGGYCMQKACESYQPFKLKFKQSIPKHVDYFNAIFCK